jgi:hypothetical protein
MFHFSLPPRRRCELRSSGLLRGEWWQFLTDVMHFLISLLRIMGLYMFRVLLAHPQEMQYNRHLVYCVRVISVGCTRIRWNLKNSELKNSSTLTLARSVTVYNWPRGELSYLASLGSEKISAPYFKQRFFRLSLGGYYPPDWVKHHASQSQDRNNKYFILYIEFCISNKI